MRTGSSDLRNAITRAYRRDEATCVAALVAELQGSGWNGAVVAAHAGQLVAAVRQQRKGASGVDHLMQEFSLSSQEGVALMCLAEALLRIPDAATADLLIRDKISQGDWQSHLGHSSSLFVNAATWGLMITGKLVSTSSEQALGNALTRLISKGGEPLIRKGVDFAMRLLGQQFVMGVTIAEALDRSAANAARGYTHSFDMLGEAAITAADAQRYFNAYQQAIVAIGKASAGRDVYAGPGISVKLSALHPRYSRAQRDRVMAELLPRLKALLLLARQCDIGFNIDAEESERLDLSLDLLEALAGDPDLAGWNGLGFVIQAYQKRCPAVVSYLIDLARRSRRRLMLRLVKGAYWDSEIKRAQVDGLEDYPVYTRKVHTDLCYLVCAKRLLDAADAVYAQFATHNAHTLAAVARMASERGVADYEFQCLHGMGEPLYDNVVGDPVLGKPCRIYAPVGSHETLLPYLVRRLLENGANSSFVNRLVDDAISIAELVADPLAQVVEQGGTRHPRIPRPPDLFESLGVERRNSAGLDLSNENVLTALDQALQELRDKCWDARPQIAVADPGQRATHAILNPANHADQVGAVAEASLDEVALALENAQAVAGEWHQVAPGERACMLERAADLLESRRMELISLCIREAGKTRANAVAEVREAVDYCRYYAQQLRELAPLPGGPAPGPVVCISPWNFPLAIFVGQLSAALAAGCPVIAKPAEQTPLIADLAVRLMHQAGVPAAVLQCLPGRGETVGAALTADPRVRGVIFTGSTEVAQLINRTLARRSEDCRLIAETGGQNAMIVDSSALLEQVVQDVLASGFDSAGQRCSALRVLCVQDDIAERLVAMLKEAMQELRIGDPGLLSTDIGPVIDAEAKANLEAHIGAMRAAGKDIYQLPLPAGCREGCFVPPTLIEIAAPGELQREVFGPVVHVLRFEASRLDALLGEINAMGYGLTCGLHSRIDETVAQVTSTVHAGNIYINRNMVGAVVGVQPFGGEGKSGTGPKAGGPLYLHRLLDTENVAPALLGCTNNRRDLPALSALQALHYWALVHAQPDLAQVCADYAGMTLLPYELALPGPTGERNSLAFFPRGDVLCVASSAADLLEQLAAALATGNSALLEDNPVCRELLGKLPSAVLASVRLDRDRGEGQYAAVLCAGDPHTAAPLRVRIAGRTGALIPVITRGAQSLRYPLHRLVAERVVSVNTTAAGGNTTLMTLGA